MEYFLTEVCSPAWNAQMDAGTSFAEGVRALTAIHPGYALQIDAYHRHWHKMLRGSIAGSVAILESLRTSGKYRILALTNWSAETITIAYRRFPFFACFEGIVVSGDVKMAKPARNIFDHLCERFGVKPSEAVFIDDSAANVLAASEIGFHAIHFRTPDKLYADLNHLAIRF